MNEAVKERIRKMLKKEIDDHSCKEVLEVGFRRGVEWYVFESEFTVIEGFLQKISSLEKENENLKEALRRTAIL